MLQIFTYVAKNIFSLLYTNMKINHVKSSIHFGSDNFPIKPFEINTPKGSLLVEEMNHWDLDKTSQWALKVMCETLPSWHNVKECLNDSDSEMKKTYQQYYVDDIKNYVQSNICKSDGNSTALIAKDKNNNVKALFDGGFLQKNNFDFGGIFYQDPKTYYINDCFVDSEYRKMGVGDKILKKLLKTTDDKFSDVILHANKPAVGFYERFGFKEVKLPKENIENLTKFLNKIFGETEHSILMCKSLDSNNSWMSRIIKRLY